MGEFETALRAQVAQAVDRLGLARTARHDYEAHLHAARVRDLLDVAARHDIDTTGWADAGLLADADLGHSQR
ncbi:hypothetical protein [Actinokineospora sp. HUAS TT18]|uniref:hypothetical protein n=1 Tax=Actinokineospora sp. HUAS TT18 TaxID=3447451 RepID=UPI003F51F9AB